MSPQMLDLDNSINCVCICDDVTGCCHGSGSNQGGRGPRASKDGSSGSSEGFEAADEVDGDQSSLERSEALKKAAAAKKKKSTLCNPPPLVNSCQLGVAHSCLYSGSKFGGFQTSKGNSYQVEVVFQVRKMVDFRFLMVLLTKPFHSGKIERRPGKLLPLRLPDDQRADGGVPDDDDLLRRGDHLRKESLSHAQVGGG